jgi:K+:H+ antiporter
MHNVDLILTVTGGLAAAVLLGYATQRLGLSPIVGYLLAGIAVGPNTPGFVANRELAGELAEIGVILLMFGRMSQNYNNIPVTALYPNLR